MALARGLRSLLLHLLSLMTMGLARQGEIAPCSSSFAVASGSPAMAVLVDAYSATVLLPAIWLGRLRALLRFLERVRCSC